MDGLIHRGMGSDLMALCGKVLGSSGHDQVRLSYVNEQVTCVNCLRLLAGKRSAAMMTIRVVLVAGVVGFLGGWLGGMLSPRPDVLHVKRVVTESLSVHDGIRVGRADSDQSYILISTLGSRGHVSVSNGKRLCIMGADGFADYNNPWVKNDAWLPWQKINQAR